MVASQRGPSADGGSRTSPPLPRTDSRMSSMRSTLSHASRGKKRKEKGKKRRGEKGKEKGKKRGKEKVSGKEKGERKGVRTLYQHFISRSLARPAPWTQRALQPQAPRHTLGPYLFSIRLTTLHAAPHGLQFCLGLRVVDFTYPVRLGDDHRPGAQQGKEGKKGKEKVSGPFISTLSAGPLRGRPLGRSVLSSPRRRATRSAHTSSPYG